MTRAISSIAADIRREWGSKVNYAAKPYLNAMLELNSVNDNFGYDSGRSVVNYFLGNASSFRGPRAAELKAELKAALKG